MKTNVKIFGLMLFFVLCGLFFMVDEKAYNLKLRDIEISQSVDLPAIKKPVTAEIAIPEEKIEPITEFFQKYIKDRFSKTPIETAKMIAAVAVEEAHKAHMNPYLVMGIIEKESGFDPTKTSKIGAAGLMQLYKCDGVEIDKKKVYDITYNIQKGIAIYQVKHSQGNGTASDALDRYSGLAGDDYIRDVLSHVGRLMLYVDRAKEKKMLEGIACAIKENINNID